MTSKEIVDVVTSYVRDENAKYALYSREYMLCKNCLLQDYDQARKMPEKCPVCGSKNVELIIEDE